MVTGPDLMTGWSFDSSPLSFPASSARPRIRKTAGIDDAESLTHLLSLLLCEQRHHAVDTCCVHGNKSLCDFFVRLSRVEQGQCKVETGPELVEQLRIRQSVQGTGFCGESRLVFHAVLPRDTVVKKQLEWQ